MAVSSNFRLFCLFYFGAARNELESCEDARKQEITNLSPIRL